MNKNGSECMEESKVHQNGNELESDRKSDMEGDLINDIENECVNVN